jgi:hypothetical protein
MEGYAIAMSGAGLRDMFGVEFDANMIDFVEVGAKW